MAELTPREMYLIGLSCSTLTAVLGGITAVLITLPFVDGGRFLRLLIGA